MSDEPRPTSILPQVFAPAPAYARAPTTRRSTARAWPTPRPFGGASSPSYCPGGRPWARRVSESAVVSGRDAQRQRDAASIATSTVHDAQSSGDRLGGRAAGATAGPRPARSPTPSCTARSCASPARSWPSASARAIASTIYMGMVPEAVIAMLACARLGAAHSVVFGGFAADALRDRINDCRRKVVLTQDGAWRRGSVVADEARRRRGARRSPTASSSVRRAAPRRPTRCPSTMKPGRDHLVARCRRRRRLDASRAEADPGRRRAPAVHPLHLGLDRQAEGRAAHTAGYLAGAHLTTKYVFDLAGRRSVLVHRRRRLGHRPQLRRVRPALERRDVHDVRGRPERPRLGPLLAASSSSHGVTILYTAPTAIRAFMRCRRRVAAERTTSRACACSAPSASPSTPRRGSGTTERSAAAAARSSTRGGRPRPASIMLTTLPGAVAAKPGSTGLPFFGVDPAVVRDDGTPVRPRRGRHAGAASGRGPRCCARSGATTSASARPTSSTMPGVYFTGDGARRDEDGYFCVRRPHRRRAQRRGPPHRHRRDRERARAAPRGRRGRRGRAPRRPQGPGARRVRHPAHGPRGQPGAAGGDSASHVAHEIGKFARPDEIRFTDALPKTRSGKIMRRFLKDIAAGRATTGDTSTLEDHGVLTRLQTSDDK